MPGARQAAREANPDAGPRIGGPPITRVFVTALLRECRGGRPAVRQVPAKWIESGRQRPGSVARREREGNFVRNRLDGVEDAFDWSELQLPGRLGADGCLYLCSTV
ncbi:unnamed protein product [Lampetra fluviatilis]